MGCTGHRARAGERFVEIFRQQTPFSSHRCPFRKEDEEGLWSTFGRLDFRRDYNMSEGTGLYAKRCD